MQPWICYEFGHMFRKIIPRKGTETLLNCSMERKGVFVSPLAFGEVGVEERILKSRDKFCIVYFKLKNRSLLEGEFPFSIPYVIMINNSYRITRNIIIHKGQRGTLHVD